MIPEIEDPHTVVLHFLRSITAASTGLPRQRTTLLFEGHKQSALVGDEPRPPRKPGKAKCNYGTEVSVTEGILGANLWVALCKGVLMTKAAAAMQPGDAEYPRDRYAEVFEVPGYLARFCAVVVDLLHHRYPRKYKPGQAEALAYALQERVAAEYMAWRIFPAAQRVKVQQIAVTSEWIVEQFARR